MQHVTQTKNITDMAYVQRAIEGNGRRRINKRFENSGSADITREMKKHDIKIMLADMRECMRNLGMRTKELSVIPVVSIIQVVFATSVMTLSGIKKIMPILMLEGDKLIKLTFITKDTESKFTFGRCTRILELPVSNMKHYLPSKMEYALFAADYNKQVVAMVTFLWIMITAAAKAKDLAANAFVVCSALLAMLGLVNLMTT